MSRCAALLVSLAIATVLPCAARAFAPIDLMVHERDGIERHHWPLTVSVPFARGELRPGTAIKVVDEHGAAAPLQSRPLATWGDGSVRWLLLDTQVEVKARKARRLRVEAGRAAVPKAAVRATDTDDAVVVDTGVIRFAVPKQRFAILDAVQLSGSAKPATGALTATLVAGVRSGQAQPPTRVSVREAGPLRVRIELQGTYGNGFDYLVRLEAYAGQPFVRVWHTFIDRFPTPYVSLPRLGLELPLNEPHPSRYRFGVTGSKPQTGSLRDDGVQLYQPDNETYRVGGSAAAGQLAGWIELEGEQGAVGLAPRWFWQEYPQSIAARADRLAYNLWAPEGDPAKVGVGAAKTHEFVLWIAPPKLLPAGVGSALSAPLLGVVDPARLARSGALPLALSPQASAIFIHKADAAAHAYAARNAAEVWDDCGAVQCDQKGIERKRTGAYGMWNWGDWNFRGYQDTTKGTDSWGNLEYDTAFVLALTYASSGDPEVYDQMVAATRHFIDVDTIYACPARPEWVGMNHPKNPLHFAFELGGPDLGHTWTQGSIAYYYLTGDERALTAARGIADYLTARVGGVVRGNPRQWGWPQIALLAVYDAVGERRYLDAALAYAKGGMRAHPATGSNQWKLGILADGLAYTHAATGDPAIKAWLEQYAAAVMQRKAREDARAFPAVAYVAALNRDPGMVAAARQRVEQLDLDGWGKPFTVNGRIGFRIESLLSQVPPPSGTGLRAGQGLRSRPTK